MCSKADSLLENYKTLLIKRYDYDKIVKIFTEKDFTGLNFEIIDFRSVYGEKIYGGVFYYPEYIAGKTVVFSHGLGGGYYNYMKEIETLCKKGYRVVAYDNVGCFHSEGENIRRITNSVSTLNCVIETIRKDKRFSFDELFLFGHSWGAFTIGNYLNISEDKKITKAVLLSPFNSIEDLCKSIFGSGDYGIIVDFENTTGLAYNTVSGGIKKSKIKTLVIQSKDDTLIKAEYGIDKIEKDKNVTLIKVNGKNHNPNYTEYAVKILSDFFSGYSNRTVKGESKEQLKAYVSNFDFYKMTEQDEEIWNKISDFLG